MIETTIDRVGVGAEQANLVGNNLVQEIFERDLIDAVNDASDDVALALHRTDDGNFKSVVTTSGGAAALVPMAVLVLAADIGFIDLDDTAELVHVLFDQSGADTVTHVPSGFVGAEAHSPHNLKGAHALFANQHQMGDPIPIPERLIGILEDGPRNKGEPIALWRTCPALPMKRLVGGGVIQFDVSAARTNDSLRPSAGDQMPLAGFLIGESSLELGDCHLVNWLGATGHSDLPSVEGYCHA